MTNFTLSENDKKNGGDQKGGAKGLPESRGTTDILFLILIICMWVAMSGVGGDAVQNGNIYRLLGPINDQGKICGIDAGLSAVPRLYYVSTTGLGICVDSCPGTSTAYTTTAHQSADNYYCSDQLHEIFTTTSNGDSAAYATAKGLWITNNCRDSTGYFDISKTTCFCMLKYASKSVFRRCAFTDATLLAKFMNNDAADYMKTYMQDIITARNVIFGFGFAVALVGSFAFLWLLSLQFLAWFVTWSCIFGVAGLMIVLVILANNTTTTWLAEDPSMHTSSQIIALKAFSGIMMGIAGLYVCLMLFMRKNINIAVKCLSMASMAIEEMPFIVFSPIMQVASFVVFLIPWVFYVLYLASMGSWKSSTSTYTNLGVSYTYVSSKKWVPDEGNAMGTKLWFLFFCMLWTMNFIASYGQMVIALAISKWYFTNPTNRVAEINNRTLCAAYATVFRYHLGTCAFGSLIIALVQFARAVALYIQKNTSAAIRANPVVQVVFCCINCCLCLLECCMKFISKNAYIQCAIHGTGFMTSAKNAFFIICRNIMRIGAVFTVSHLAIIAGKLFVCMLATGTSYYYFTGAYADKLHDFVAPTILVMIISWMTASMFFDVLQMSIDTILMCYIADEEANDGTAQFAGAKMNDFVKEHGAISEEEHHESKCCGCGSKPAPAAEPTTAQTGTGPSIQMT